MGGGSNQRRAEPGRLANPTRSAPRRAPLFGKRRESSVRRCRCSGARSADIRGGATPATPPRRPSAARLFYKYLVVITSSAPGRRRRLQQYRFVSFGRSGSRRWSSATRSDPGASSCLGKDRRVVDTPPRRRPRFPTRSRRDNEQRAAGKTPPPPPSSHCRIPRPAKASATMRDRPSRTSTRPLRITSCPGTQRPTPTAR